MLVSHAVTVWCNKGLILNLIAFLFLIMHYAYAYRRHCNILLDQLRSIVRVIRLFPNTENWQITTDILTTIMKAQGQKFSWGFKTPFISVQSTNKKSTNIYFGVSQIFESFVSGL